MLAYKGRLALVFFMLTLASLATLTIPVALRFLIDNGFSQDNVGQIDRYFAAMLAVVAVLAFSSAGRFYFVMQLGERVIADIRKAVYAHLVTLSPHFYERTKTGEILSRLTTDTTLIQSIVGASASIALRNVFMFIGAAVMLVITSPRLSAYFLLLAPAVILPLVLFGRMVRGQSNQAQEKVADTSALASESLGSIQTVQAFTQESQEVDHFWSAVEGAFVAGRRRIRSQAFLTATIIFLVFASIVGILWTGARFVIGGTISAGMLGQFILYAVMAAASLGALSEVWGEVQRAVGASERLMSLLRAPSDVRSPKEPKSLPRGTDVSLEFSGVEFRYPSRDQIQVLHDFNLSVKAGEKIALVGPSGAGKSTVFQLLLRFYDPQDGTIKLSGIDIRDLDLAELRQSYSLVAQDPAIFGTSARNNILYGRTEASFADVTEAAKIAMAHDFIERLPEGFDTDLGSKGVTLSGGQRQRIAIARAVLRNAPILLLDEATSALDSGSERLVQEALDRVMEDRTTIIIAHRLSTVLKADRIVVMDEGRIAEIGTHEELTAKGGLYSQLAKLQFGAEGQSDRPHIVAVD